MAEGSSAICETKIREVSGGRLDDHEIEDAWSAEVGRRIGEIESGRAKLTPAADSIARARAAIK